jgi:NTE family protein
MNRRTKPTQRFAANTMATQAGFALQGGGNHGAFTWGVLRVLLPYLEQRGIPLAGFIGDSAGAMNAVYAGYGWAKGTPDKKAEQADFMLERLWWTMHREAFFVRQYMSARSLINPTTAFSELVRQGSQQFKNVLNAGEMLQVNARHPALPLKWDKQNHLEYVVGQQIDFTRLARSDAPMVIVNTANVRDGGLDAFYGDKLSAKAVGGSGTLPQLFETMQIGEGSHWDGGYIANPPLQPLYNACPQMTDLFMIRITPLHMRTPHMPRSDAEKADRTMEMLLNSAVEAELRWVHQHARDTGRKLNIHVISVPLDWPHDLTSKVDFNNTQWDFFKTMREAGEQAGKRWLIEHAAKLGQQDSYRLPYRLHGEQAGQPHRKVKYG